MTTVKKTVIAIGAVGIIAYLAFEIFGVQALFINKSVDEAVPVVSDTSSPEAIEEAPTEPETPTPQTPPPQIVSRVASGSFQQGDSTYTISGDVQVTQQGGVRTLAFTDFSVTNGPDLFVYLVNEPQLDNESVKRAVEEDRFVNLGALKGNIGNQTYTLPEGIELEEGAVISIWCRRFSRNFGMALVK